MTCAYTKTARWVAAAMLTAGFAAAQSNEIGNTDFSTWANVTYYPNAQASNLSYWQAEAIRVAGDQLWYEMSFRSILHGAKYPLVGQGYQPDLFVDAAQPFDDLYFVGSTSVSAWALDTGSGLILIDALYNPDEAERIIIPGLQSFGFEGSDIKALIITHEHLDHYGGAGWLQSTFDIPTYASQPAWDLLATVDGAPTQDHVIEDGEKITVGNVSISAYHTPGHTPGTVSLLIPVHDHGVAHLAGMYGGNGIPRTAEDKTLQIQSFHKWRGVVEPAGVDVLIGNHQTHDRTLQNLDILANRECGTGCGNGCSLPNPYVIGNERYMNYFDVMEIAVRVQAARADHILMA